MLWHGGEHHAVSYDDFNILIAEETAQPPARLFLYPDAEDGHVVLGTRFAIWEAFLPEAVKVIVPLVIHMKYFAELADAISDHITDISIRQQALCRGLVNPEREIALDYCWR